MKEFISFRYLVQFALRCNWYSMIHGIFLELNNPRQSHCDRCRKDHNNSKARMSHKLCFVFLLRCGVIWVFIIGFSCKHCSWKQSYRFFSEWIGVFYEANKLRIILCIADGRWGTPFALLAAHPQHYITWKADFWCCNIIC